jgi:hypothetical protein
MVVSIFAPAQHQRKLLSSLFSDCSPQGVYATAEFAYEPA